MRRSIDPHSQSADDGDPGSTKIRSQRSGEQTASNCRPTASYDRDAHCTGQRGNESSHE